MKGRDVSLALFSLREQKPTHKSPRRTKSPPQMSLHHRQQEHPPLSSVTQDDAPEASHEHPVQSSVRRQPKAPKIFAPPAESPPQSWQRPTRQRRQST